MTDTTAHDTLQLANYASRAYLEYAMSVVKGRALPDVRDGQKPVQRRILYAMREMGLAHNSKAVKSARVVGEILGKYHPHGDSSAYEAMVRMAQDFSLRYPLIDGIGNFGSRDGDGAAAMRYTEARLTPVAQLLLAELDMGTADFVPNYDGAFEEPLCLPARLPMVLLNGASGIAVGMATEIPPHNLTEVGNAAIALLHNPELTTADLMQHLPAPDFAGGGHIITPNKDLQSIYETGKGSIRVRARYEIEKLARGQWRMIVGQLPPQTSAAKVLAEIEELTNPKPKTGKKSLTQEQLNNRALMLSLLEKARDESDNDHPVRLVFEPKSGKIDPEMFIATLMAQTSLEGNQAINLVMVGNDGRPAQKNLKTILQEWLNFRIETVTRRLQHRLNQVEKRIHILEGRQIVLLHIDHVIAVIREADEPKPELMQAFGLTEIQAEDILEIRLRQLARLEAIRIEKELNQLLEEAGYLKTILGDEQQKRYLIIQEIQSDVQQYGDSRRTLVEQAERATLVRQTADEALTLILSQKGWIRSRSGHNLDLSGIAFKEGDALMQAIECRSIEAVVALDNNGRSYTLNPADIPGGRGDGIPLASLIDIQNNGHIITLLNAPDDALFLLAGSGGYGFAVRFAELTGRIKSGKEIIRLEENEHALPAIRLPEDWESKPIKLLLASREGRLLAFDSNELKILAKGRGLQLMSLNEGDQLLQVACVAGERFMVESRGKRGGVHRETLRVADVANKRGRKGRQLELNGQISAIAAEEEQTS